MSHYKTDKQKLTVIGSLVWFVGALFYCYEFLLRILPGTLQQEISQGFGGISATSFGQLAALYYFAYSPMQLPVGMLIDRFGTRKLLTFACLSCTVGSYFFMCFSHMWVAGIGRFLVGFGSSFAFVGGLTIAMNWLPRQYFSFATGLMTTLGMLGLMYGGIKITALAQVFEISQVLWMTVLFGGILTILIYLFVRENPNLQHTKQPLPQFFSEVKHVLLSKEVWLIGIVAAFLYTSLSVFGELWGKSYLEQAHGLTKIQAAKGISALFFGWAVGAPLSGFISDKTGKRGIFLILGALGSLFCIATILYVGQLSYIHLMLLLFFYGVFSGTEIIAFVMAKESSGAALSGTVFAAINMIVTLGGVIFQPLVGFLLDRAAKAASFETLGGYGISDYQQALGIIPASLVMVMVIGLFLKDSKTS